MIYIVLTVLTSVFLLSLFKLFSRFQINTFQAIVVNYITAALTGLIFSGKGFDSEEILHSNFIFLCVPLGILFILVFYLISLTTQHISISAASVANKMSVVMPVLFSLFIIGDTFTFLKFSGIVLALIAVYLTTRVKKEEHPAVKIQWWLPALVFAGSGLIDISISAAKMYYLRTPREQELFTVFTFVSAFCVGCIILAYQFFSSKGILFTKRVIFNSIIGGILLGIPNYFSIFFIIKALDSKVLSNLELFPVLNISNVVLSAMVGVLLFKEKLSSTNGFGIALAIVSIILVSI